FFVCLAGWRLARRTVETLTDTAPPGIAELVTALTQRLPGVVAVDRVRVREAGGALFIDLLGGVGRTLPLDRVAAVKERIVQAIRAEMPRAEVNVGTEP